MATITLLDSKGKKSSKEQSVNDALFGLEPNEHLLYLAKVRQESNARAGTAHTKTRMEVRGGGAKPWRQKGTGRARAGSRTSPLWRGGGVIFGPRKNVNWTKGMNKKESARAILSALNLKNKANALVAIEALASAEGKTKELAQLIEASGFKGQQVVLVTESGSDELTKLKRAASNLVGATVLAVTELNVKDLLKADQVVISSKALEEIEERFADVTRN
ncbi:MAG: 50S ribosomal protein L4 [Candidatus Melainabacteria bacterium]|nr:50S ribosomal protein L4 [Candidatus Melainabacteria bacterium]